MFLSLVFGSKCLSSEIIFFKDYLSHTLDSRDRTDHLFRQIMAHEELLHKVHVTHDIYFINILNAPVTIQILKYI